MPVTTIAIILPACFLLGLIVPENVMNVVYHVLPVVVGLMFITDIRIPKLDVVKLFRKPAEKKKKKEER